MFAISLSTLFKRSWEIATSIPKAYLHFQKYPPVFIIGAPRSGTTLTLKLFQNQPGISTAFEPFIFWKKAFRQSEDDRYISPTNRWLLPQFSYTYLKDLYYHQTRSDKPYLVSKDPRDSIRIETLDRVFPNAKYIHVIRDGRDVIASTMKTFQNEIYRNDWYFSSDEWVHVRIPGYREILDRPPHIRAAIQWKACVETSLEHLSRVPDDRQFLFYYEQLLASPEEVSTKIFKFAYPELEPAREELQKIIYSISDQVIKTTDTTRFEAFDRRLSWSEKLEQLSLSVQGDAGSGTTAESSRIARWKKDLDPRTLSECDAIVGDLLQKLGYDR
jgi:hypothetical protein